VARGFDLLDMDSLVANILEGKSPLYGFALYYFTETDHGSNRTKARLRERTRFFITIEGFLGPNDATLANLTTS
jgi:hypothetical protein